MPKKSTRHLALRGVLKTEGLTTKETAEEIGVKYSTLQNMLQGKIPWELDIAMKLRDLFELPYEDIPYYFQEKGAIRRPTPTDHSKTRGASGKVLRLAR